MKMKKLTGLFLLLWAQFIVFERVDSLWHYLLDV